MCSSPSDVWKLGRLNHVAIATPDLSAAATFYRDVLRAKSVSPPEDLPEHGVTTVFVEVDDIEATARTLKENGVRCLAESSKIGAHGKPVMFLHPKDCGGVLTELEQA